MPTKFQPEDRDSMTGTERELEDAFTGYEEATVRLIDEDTDEKEAVSSPSQTSSSMQRDQS